jgi:ATP-dependent RNA circularization protein (DNA/RNA ligase family)
MGRYITVSVKLPLEVNEKLGLKPSKLLRRIEVDEVKREVEEIQDLFRRFSREFVVKSIREDREGR